MRGQDWNPATLMKASGAYWQSCAIHSGVELGIFTALHNESMTVDALARQLGCDLRGLATLLTALCALGLLQKEGDHYAADAAARQYLSEQSPEYFGHIILHHQHLVPAWSRLSEAVRNGRSTRESSHRTEDAAQREHFLLGMFNVASQQAHAAAAALDLRKHTRLLDLGGGPGAYAVHFCLQNPQLSAIVYDLPTTRPFAEKIIARYKLAQRIQFMAGDFLQETVTGRYDVVWISQVLHAMDNESSALLLEKAARVLTPGGLLLIQEFVLNDTRDGPAHPALFGCNMLVGTEAGKVYTEKELFDLLRRVGASDVRRLALDLPMGCGIVSGSFPM
ncbi:MAG: methyltransferase domain-containing protein [Deltaproteobacteria bacterium]|nr:methyltransferase domain-containing protein [Deltaproteobacteria bacterium]